MNKRDLGIHSKFIIIFDGLIQFFIFISIITFSIETLPSLTEDTRYFLEIVEVVIIIIFTIEYLLRLYFSEGKIKFIFSFYGIIDILAILPFFLSASVDLRFLRALRFFRIFHVLKLVRYSKAIQRFHKAILLAKEELVLYFTITIVLLYFAAVGIYYFERDAQPDKFTSVFDSLWWAVATLTTVGYGDVYPVTIGGRLFTFFLLLIGLGIVAVPAGVISSALDVSRKLEEDV